MLTYYDIVNSNNGDFQCPSLGLFNSPNGFHGWGGNVPTGQMVDSYEMIDGSKFSWDNPEHKAEPYKNRDPRFYACVLYDGAKWRQRPDDVIGSDPEELCRRASMRMQMVLIIRGWIPAKGPIEDWNGTYTGYYMRKVY